MMPSSLGTTHANRIASELHVSTEPVTNGSNSPKPVPQHRSTKSTRQELHEEADEQFHQFSKSSRESSAISGDYRGETQQLPPLIHSNYWAQTDDANHHVEGEHVHSERTTDEFAADLSSLNTGSNFKQSDSESYLRARRVLTSGTHSPYTVQQTNTHRIEDIQLTTNPDHMIRSESRKEHVARHVTEHHRSTLPAEDIVDSVMPLEGSPTRLKLFEAPPWMKRSAMHNPSSSGHRTPNIPPGTSKTGPTATISTPIAGRGPIVIERRPIRDQSSTVITSSHFRRGDSLPSSLIYRRRKTRESNPEPHGQTSSATSGERMITVQNEAPLLSANRAGTVGESSESRSPVQIVRSTRHDDGKVIEVSREHVSDSRTMTTSRNVHTASPKPPRPPRSNDSRARTKSPPGRTPVSGELIYPHYQTETNQAVCEAVSHSNRYEDVNHATEAATTGDDHIAKGSAHWQRADWSETGASPFLERASFRTANRNNRVSRTFRSVRSTPSSPVLGHSANRIGSRTPGLDGDISRAATATANYSSSISTGLPPPSQRIPASRLGQSIRTQLSDNLTPIGPPVEHVTTRIDPVTGLVQKVTARTQSFTDVSKNVFVTETDENIEDDHATEYHIKRHTIRKRIPSTSKGSRSNSKTERPIEQQVVENQTFHSKSMDDDVAQWNRQFYQTADARPYRAVSQTNVSSRAPITKNNWISESNLRTTTTYKQPPMYSTYSAHRENMRRQEEQRRNAEDWNASKMHLEESKSATGTEVLEEMETITLQPIGRGVHDLEPTGSIARSYRANTPTASQAFTPGLDQSDGYRTIATTNVHREVHTSGAPSPYAGTHHNQFYESTTRGAGDTRYKMINNQTEANWRGAGSTSAAYPGTFLRAGSEFGAASGHSEVIASDLMQQVKDTFMDWYLPEKTREEVNTMLRDKEPGSFIIRNSISYVNSFSIGLKIPQNSPHVQTRPDDIKSGFVRHFIIGTVPMNDGRGDGLQLCGFVNQPVFPSLVAFVHHHILQPGPFPCTLRLPGVGPISQTNLIPVQHSRMTYASQASPMSGVGGATGFSVGGDGVAADMLYLGPVEVDRLESAAAVRRAITQILSQAASSPTGLPKRCEVLIKAIPHDGVTFVDKTKRTMLRKHIKPTQLLWCGMDPENRTFPDPELRARGQLTARTFGIVARRQHFFMHENVVYVFCELDPSQSAFNLIQYINSVFIGH